MFWQSFIRLAAVALLLITAGSTAAVPLPAIEISQTRRHSALGLVEDDVILLLPLIMGENGRETGQAPHAADDRYGTIVDTPLKVDATNGVLANDTDTGGETLVAVLLDNVRNGTLSLNEDGSFDYSSTPSFEGQDLFTYQASDGVSSSSAALVTITVTSQENKAPVAKDDSYQASEDVPLFVAAEQGVLANDTDPELDPLQAVLVGGVSSGVLELAVDGSFEYTLAPGFNGQDSFSYQAEDAFALSNIATVTIDVLPTNSAPQIVTGKRVFEKQVIDDDVEQVHAVEPADFDGDGDYDFVATDYVKGMLVLFINDGTNVFTRETLDPNLEGAYPAHVADVDQDGDMDALAGGYLGDTFAWYENDGSANFTRRDIDTNTDGAHSIVVVDLDEDGDNDFLTTSQDAGVVAWYENDGALNFERHAIDTTATAAKRAEAADMDGDGDLDVVTASWKIDEIAWLENDGEENFTKFVIDTKANGAYYVSPADIDGDGDNDIFSASRLDHTFAWYRNDGRNEFFKQTIDTSAGGARTILAVDMDRDGDIDALGASREDDTFAWYENDGTEKFKERIIDAEAKGAYGLSPVDVDFDGDIDLFTASRGSGVVSLHTQIQAHYASVAKGGTLVINSALLRTVDADDGPAEITYRLTKLPDYGEVRLDGVAVPLDGTFTQEAINDGRVTYVHDGSNQRSDVFTFSVFDGGENGVMPAQGTFTIER